MKNKLKFNKSELKTILEEVQGDSESMGDFFDSEETKKPGKSSSHFDWLIDEAIEDIKYAGQKLSGAYKAAFNKEKKLEIKKAAVELSKVMEKVKSFYGTIGDVQPNE